MISNWSIFNISFIPSVWEIFEMLWMSYCTLTEDKCELAKERDTLLEFWITDQISSTVIIKNTYISYNKVECKINKDKDICWNLLKQ